MTIATDFYDRVFNQVNTIVEAAINHGGDVGGPYYSSPRKLEESMVSLKSFSIFRKSVNLPFL